MYSIQYTEEFKKKESNDENESVAILSSTSSHTLKYDLPNKDNQGHTSTPLLHQECLICLSHL